MRPAELIEQKRNGGEHDPGELAELILAYARDEVPDYQLAAWCMAVYFRGLTAAETHALTDAMIRSGETLDLGAAPRPQGRRQALDRRRGGQDVDRRRPDRRRVRRAAREDVGRGLGHTGGTLDKLESIPGFRVELTTEEFVAQLREVGMAIVGPDRGPRPGRQEALRAARRDGDRRHRAADRELDHVEEARRRRAGDRPRRQGRRRRVHEDARRRASARRGDARDRDDRRAAR